MDIQLARNGDIEIVNNSFVLVEGLDAKRQHVSIRFQFFSGEWFLDTSLGVPYFEEILIKAPTFAVVSQILKTTVLDTPGILSLTKFDFSSDNARRIASLSFKALCEEGEINFAQLIPIGKG